MGRIKLLTCEIWCYHLDILNFFKELLDFVCLSANYQIFLTKEYVYNPRKYV